VVETGKEPRSKEPCSAVALPPSGMAGSVRCPGGTLILRLIDSGGCAGAIVRFHVVEDVMDNTIVVVGYRDSSSPRRSLLKIEGCSSEVSSSKVNQRVSGYMYANGTTRRHKRYLFWGIRHTICLVLCRYTCMIEARRRTTTCTFL